MLLIYFYKANLAFSKVGGNFILCYLVTSQDLDFPNLGIPYNTYNPLTLYIGAITKI